jgi:hypothetical protein
MAYAQETYIVQNRKDTFIGMMKWHGWLGFNWTKRCRISNIAIKVKDVGSLSKEGN